MVTDPVINNSSGFDPSRDESAEPEVAVFEPRWKTALRRSTALIIDFLSLRLLLLVPAFLTVSDAAQLRHHTIDFVWALRHDFRDPATLGLFCQNLSISPIPLIFMRVFFKCFHDWETPGEKMTGIRTRSNQSGFRKLVKEICYGFFQWLFLAYSLLISLLAFFLPYFLPGRLPLPRIPYLVFDPLSPGFPTSEQMMPADIVIVQFVFLILLHLPRTRRERANFSERIWGYEVEKVPLGSDAGPGWWTIGELK